MADASTPEHTTAGPEAIGSDLPCRRCGYNLRGLTVETLCPECGEPAGNSLITDGLDSADASWLKLVRLGVTLRIIAAGVLLVTGLFGFLDSRLGLLRLFPIPPLFASRGLHAVAIFLLTAFEPLGKTARFAIGLPLLLQLTAVAVVAGSILQLVLVDDPAALWGVFYPATALATITVGIGECTYGSALSRRIPNDRLVRRFRFVANARAVCYVPLAAVGIDIVVRAFQRPPSYGPLDDAFTFSCIVLGGLGTVVFEVWFAWLLVGLRRELARALSPSRHPPDLEVRDRP